MEKDIETHIEKDKRILEDPTISPQMRHYTADELESLERYHKEHQKIIMIPLHLKCTAMKTLKQTSVGSTRTEYDRRVYLKNISSAEMIHWWIGQVVQSGS